MIFARNPKTIKVMLTTFRDGLQSTFGGNVRLQDYLPAMKAAAESGFSLMEFGGGARFQTPYFYLGENPFDTMKMMRKAAGPDADLQILTRSVSGVTLTSQSIESLSLQAKLMKASGATRDRNFDYMNDVDNLIKTGKPIVEAGMHHQVCIALMGMPFKSDKVHTAEFYISIGQRLLASDIQIDSICLKDASGTTDPTTIYNTVIGLKKIMPAEMLLWLHTHDTASMAVACYMAGIEGGVDGVDLSVRPMASGTVQPDVRSLAHALKGTGYSLDVDATKVQIIEDLLNEGLKDYEFNPATTTADARVLGFPMPGGAIGPNVHMMVKAGIIQKYSEVLAEFPVVVEAGGAWTSVTPGSQQYWLQAFNNVMYGRWDKIDPGYGRAVLGYFGKTPLPPDPEVVKKASMQLGLPVFEGDPLSAAPKNIEAARKALEEKNLTVNDENIFLVLAAMVPDKKIDINEGIKLLTKNPRIEIPLKRRAAPETIESVKTNAAAASHSFISDKIIQRCTVEENGKSRTFIVTLEADGNDFHTVKAEQNHQTEIIHSKGIPVYTAFSGTVEVVDILVKAGDKVEKGKVVAQVEAMKAKHHIKAPRSGIISSINVKIGDTIDSSKPILFIA
jgi:pyruvate carboxylase subunit B